MYFGGLVTAVFWGLKNNCVLSLLVFGVLLFTVKYIVLFMQSLGLHAAPLAVYKFKTEMYIYCVFFSFVCSGLPLNCGRLRSRDTSHKRYV